MAWMDLFRRDIIIVYETKEWKEAVFQKILKEFERECSECTISYRNSDRELFIKSPLGTVRFTYCDEKELCGVRADECYFQPCLFRKSYRFKTREMVDICLGACLNLDYCFVIIDMDENAENNKRLRSMGVGLANYIRQCAKDEPHLKEDYPYLFL